MIQISPETRAFIRAHQEDDVRALALQAKKYPEVDMPTAIVQIAGRKVATEKIPSWRKVENIVYPKHLSLEQCSSETTARYKADLLSGESFADLTGGFGIDCSFISSQFKASTYVERQKELCEIAAHNFPLLGLNHVRVVNDDGVAFLSKMEPIDCLFLDPARRNEQGGKTVSIADCEPNVKELEDLLLDKATQVMIKLSPMLDLSLALKDLPSTHEIHVISVNNECKELLLLISRKAVYRMPIHCINFTAHEKQCFIFTREQEQECDCVYTSDLKPYIFEPNASILKAGGYRSLASHYQIEKLHPNSHLYTSDQPIADFPGRTFRMISQSTFNKKEMKEKLGDLQKANLTVRNFPASVAELRKRTKLEEGGDTYLFATTLHNEQKILIRCEKYNNNETLR